MMPAAQDGEVDLERTRAELRRLGYLDHGLERFFLQDALRPRQPLRTLALLAAKVGVLGGGLLAAALAVALAVANGSLQASPLDLPILFLHLFVPLSAAVAAAFLALGSAVLVVLRVYHVRRIEAVALATSLVAGLAGLLLALWEARESLAQSGAWQRAALAAAAVAAAYALVRLIYQGLLALAIRFSARAPAAGLLAWRWRRWVSGAVLAGVLLVAVPVMLAARSGEPPLPSLLPIGPGAAALVIGLDGVLPEEAEYLLRHGDLPAMAELARTGGRGGRLLSYSRPDEPPAAFWTSLATGLAPGRHGVAAVDSFLPAGVRTPLGRSGMLRPYWQHVEVPLRLAEYRPLLANRRSAFTFWELASRGGAPVLAANWWATFPAPPVPGLVLAHDAYQLLQQGMPGAVSDIAAAPALLRLLHRFAAAAPPEGMAAAGDAIERLLAAALPAAARRQVEERAVWPDEFYRAVFAARLGVAGGESAPSAGLASAAPAVPRAAALYLPGLDIAASDWRGGDLAFADLVRGEARAADRLLAAALARPGWGIVAVVLDPGRRRRGGGAVAGRVLLWRRGAACGGGPAETTPEAVTAALLRTLGLPQSAELPPPPQCAWPEAPARVATFGRPAPPRLPGAAADPADPANAASAAEYLQNLRSLGYL